MENVIFAVLVGITYAKIIKFIDLQENGGFAEYVRVPAKCIFPLPKNISKEEGCLIEPLAVVVHTLKLANLSGLEDILVLGSGTIGLLCIKLLRRITLGKILALTGKSELKAKRALEFGEDKVIISERENPIEEILKETNKKGVDAIFEAAGVENTLKFPLKHYALVEN